LLRLKTPWKDGSTHVVYEPLDFVAKLAALVPRPHKNLVVYHGVLAANAAWRSRVWSYGRQGGPVAEGEVEDVAASNAARYLRRQWAQLMRRSFGFEVLECADCGGRMRLMGVIFDRAVIRRILSHIGLSCEPRIPAAARAPPECDLLFDDFAWSGPPS
jgi:hypothetical protein